MLKFFKKRILNAAKKSGCDLDGDIIIYRGKRYYVDILNDICVETETPEQIKRIPFIKRFFVTFRLPM